VRMPEPLRIAQLGNLTVIIDKFGLFGKGTTERQNQDERPMEDAEIRRSS